MRGAQAAAEKGSEVSCEVGHERSRLKLKAGEE